MRVSSQVLIPLLVLAAAQAVAGGAMAQPRVTPLSGQPLAGQVNAGLEQNHDAALAADQAALRRNEVALQNELASEAARARSDRTLGDLKASTVRPQMPAAVPVNPGPSNTGLANTGAADASQFADIPNATLAASNARAVAASQNRK